MGFSGPIYRPIVHEVVENIPNANPTLLSGLLAATAWNKATTRVTLTAKGLVSTDIIYWVWATTDPENIIDMDELHPQAVGAQGSVTLEWNLEYLNNIWVCGEDTGRDLSVLQEGMA